MFEIRTIGDDGYKFSPIMFDSLEKAFEYFKRCNEMGFMCALYNLK